MEGGKEEWNREREREAGKEKDGYSKVREGSRERREAVR